MAMLRIRVFCTILCLHIGTLLGYSQEEKEVFIEALIGKMTLKEKVGQMTNLGVTSLVAEGFWTDTDSVVLDHSLMRTYITRYGVGSFQGKGAYPPESREWQKITNEIQSFAKENSRLGIPVLLGIDAVHGAHYTADATIFPHQIGLGATLDTQLVRRIAQATSQDLAACGLSWNFSPVLDLAWQPMWGRIEETFSADAFVVAAMGVAYTTGAQSVPGVGVCLKHLAGYSFPYSGKDRSPAYIAPADLHQFFLRPFSAAIHSGASSVMLNSGSVNGMPGHVDSTLIMEVKNGWGFSGFTISDWDDITKLVEMHRVAVDYKAATRMAVMAGMDMCMVPYDSTFSVALIELVQEQKVPMSRIDDAVRRILGVKYDLGLWNTNNNTAVLERHDDLALEAATKSMVLLENDGTLPLTSLDKLVIAGPAANSLTALNGPWSRTWKGDDPRYDSAGGITFFDGILEKQPTARLVAGAAYDTLAVKDWTASFATADKVILALGEPPTTEKNSDINDLRLPAAQRQLIQMAAASGKPFIIVLCQGRPRLLPEEAKQAGAIIHAFYPGEMGGKALAALLYGDDNFSGKLPYTYPKHPGHMTGYPYRGTDYIDQGFGMNGYPPAYPFGFGKSYTTFSYSPISCNRNAISVLESLTCQVTITNTGSVAGRETLQWYIKDEIASVSPVDWRMVGFQSVMLAPGESETLTFTLPADELAMANYKGKWVLEPGYFQIGAGTHSKALQTHRFFLEEY